MLKEMAADAREFKNMKNYFEFSLRRLLVMTAAVLLALAWSGQVQAADELSLQLQRGLLAEEAHRDYNAALKAYQAAVAAYDTNRQAAATAVFRLAETYRKLGKTNEARGQYERVMIEFADQTALVGAASKQLQVDFGKMAVPALAVPSGPADDPQHKLLLSELRMREAQLASFKKLKPSDLPLALIQSQYNDILNGLLKTQDELMVQRVVKSKEFSREHPEIVKLETAFKENDRLIADHVRIVMERMEERVKLLREQLDGGGVAVVNAGIPTRSIPTRSIRMPTPPIEQREPQIPAEEQAEIERLQAMLKNSPDLINATPTSGGLMPLHEAASKGYIYVAKFLLTNNANVNLKTAQGYTALHYAAEGGHKAMAELLLANEAQYDAKVNISNRLGKNQFTALHIAADKGFAGVAAVLIAKGALVNNQDKNGYTALHYAVAKEDFPITKLLLDNKADVNIKANSSPKGNTITEHDWTPLHLAAKSGNVAMMHNLVMAGAKVDEPDRRMRTPLHVAVENGHEAAADYLLANKANVNAKNIDGTTPLMLANRASMAQSLLASKAEVNARDNAGKTALQGAVEAANEELVGMLLRRKADPNIFSEGATPLMRAVLLGDIGTVKALLDGGADPNKISPMPNTTRNTPFYPVQVAVVNKRADLVEMLLAYKADAGVTDEDGFTLLHQAVANWDRPMVESLLKNKLNPNAASKNGYTPLLLARLKYSGNLLEPGGPAMPEGRIPDLQQDTKMLPAAVQEMVALLIEHGADGFGSRRPHIAISRRGKGNRIVFSKDSAGVNRFSLFEVLGWCYGGSGVVASYQFPDFSRISINRLQGNQEKSIAVNLADALETGDVSQDVWLEWGDVVEIPEADHALSMKWDGLGSVVLNTLRKTTGRKVQLSVKNQIYNLDIGYFFIQGLGLAPGAVSVQEREVSAEGRKTIEIRQSTMNLSTTVFYSRALLSSSDTKRVKVTRKLPNGEKKEMVYDIGAVQKTPDDLWLRDGDVIEVPEKE